MNEHDILTALTDVRAEHILAAAPGAARPRFDWRPALAAAACLAVLVGLGGWALAAESREYNTAVEFFQTHELPTDGLTRTELKAVYRDITTNSFTYEKTGEVLAGGRTTGALSGLNITPAAVPAAPEELKALWEAMDSRKTFPYQLRWDYREDPELGFEVLEKSFLEHCEEGTLVWKTEFAELQADSYRELTDGVLVWGCTPRWSSEQPSHPWAAKVSRDGAVLWQVQLDHGYHFEVIWYVLEDPDGTCAVFSRGETDSLVFTRLSPDGEELLVKATALDAPYGIQNAAHLGEEYILQLGNTTLTPSQRIVRVDREGTLTDEFHYTADDSCYFINDMAEFGGKLYLSAHSVPALEDGEDAGCRYDIAGVLNSIEYPWTPGEDGMVTEAGEKTVAERMKEHYTAVLLVCDPGSGTPETFYTVQGAVGGRLSVEGDRLLWDAEQFVTAKFSPYTSAYSILAECRVLRSAFDAAGALADQVMTDETVIFSR